MFLIININLFSILAILILDYSKIPLISQAYKAGFTLAKLTSLVHLNSVFFKVDDEDRFVEMHDISLNINKVENPKVDPENRNQIGASL